MQRLQICKSFSQSGQKYFKKLSNCQILTMSGLQSISSAGVSRSSDLETKCCPIQHRWVFCILAFLAIFISSIMFSLPSLLHETKTISLKNINGSDFCSINHNFTLKVSVLKDPNSATKYITLFAIHWGYLLSCFPAGIFSDQFGGKYIMTLSLLFSSFWCLVTPAIAVLSKNRPGWMAGTQFFRGFFKGIVFPTIMSLLAQWAPDTERTKMVCLVYGSYFLSQEISTEIQKFLPEKQLYFLFGSIGVVFCFCWHLFLYPTPEDHPSITPNELKFLDENTEDRPVKGRKNIPWAGILTSGPFWAVLILQIGLSWNWVVYFYAYDIYLPGVLKFEDYENTIWRIPFYLCFGFALIYGFISDWFIKEKLLSVTILRKIAALIGNSGSAFSLLFVIFGGCHSNAVMIHFTVGLCFQALFYLSCRVNHLDLTSNFAGTLMGMTRIFDRISEYVVDSELSYLLTIESSLRQWAGLFWFTFGLNLLSTCVFLILASGIRQGWNYVK
ncbi:putative inorganic phosphate cotransporter [Tribolium madens]|uniref:putative inorganic phosphate cotransporter n=1 Tax=Tribolium madens TaxID=41895 RepID=UPI001CF73B63|nr:putative inorganic phosphate cotransporter [Tribolium madens]